MCVRYFNQVNFPLVHGEDWQLVLYFVDLSELCLFLGINNKFFNRMIEDVERKWDRSVYDWAHDRHIVPNKYRGGELNGPACNKLVDNHDSLQDFVPQKFHNFVSCLKIFKKVAKACFGTVLGKDWKKLGSDFEIAFRALDISNTPRLHNMFHEMIICIEKFDIPLEIHGEQKFE